MNFFSKTVKNFFSLIIVISLGLFFSPFFLSTEIVQADLLQTSVLITVCGNGVVDAGESCDDGVNNGRYAYNAADRFCNSTCSGWAPYCGDGTVQSSYDEECDDGNNVSGDGCDAVCGAEETPSQPGGGGWYTSPIVTKVVLQGKAYPGSIIHILKDGKEITTTKTDSAANFKKEIAEITSGIYTFGLWTEDKDGVKSITYTLTFSVSVNTVTTVSGIFLPPTISLDKTFLPRGGTLNIFGQTIPEVEVEVYVASSEVVEKVCADAIGAWLLAFNTAPLDEGEHTTKSRFQLNNEERSGFGRALSFYIGEKTFPSEDIFRKADFNDDGKINLVDFSIFLMWWEKTNSQYDLNQDGTVDLADLSIFLCYWTG